ncbi:bZIP transcription factor 44, partial [Mucuna pruriens]
MASPGGAYSSGSSSLQNSGWEGEREMMEERKRKRMQSNRESARRSRMRKQQHVEGLSGQLEELKREKEEMREKIGMTREVYLKVEAENAILRAQMAELSNRLQSMEEIISFINSTNYLETDLFNDCAFVDPWNTGLPLVASADTIFIF